NTGPTSHQNDMVGHLVPRGRRPLLDAALDEGRIVREGDPEWRAVLRLPPRQRAMVVLRYYEDLSEARTAEVLGVSVGTVKSAVSRAMSRLRMDARLAALAAPEGSAESAGAAETTGAEILPGPPLATGRRRGARGGAVGRGPATVVARAA
ncbi:histidine kinase N-terminal domain-containing protein, partial [Streptomyces alkaliphilus]|uniref:histidine kinase N-terminal domain-containing protein n=1 Tax=Streptomyces alkaliphilus TaxID=1472722 RepID=UPI0018872FB6